MRQIERDVDPQTVSDAAKRWARYVEENAHWMNDKRCEPGAAVWHDGSCCFCGAEQGVSCRLDTAVTPRYTPEP